MSDFSAIDVPRAWSAPLRPLAATGAIAAVFIVLCGIADLAQAWCEWHAAGVAADFIGGSGEVAGLVAADRLSVAVAYSGLAIQSLAGVAFLVWLWRARVNSETLSPATHRHTRGWTIGGWFCPIVSFWFPQRIVTDVWRTSRPEAVNTHYADELPGSKLVTAWWVLFLLSSLFTRYVVVAEIGGAHSVGALRDGARDLLIGGIAHMIAAVLAVLIIAKIYDAQRAPRTA